RAGTITVTADGEPVTLGADDLIVTAEGVVGWQVGREDGVTIALDSTITDSLRERGLAREVVNRIQRLRKQAGYHVADRMRVAYSAEEDFAGVTAAHKAMIARETLAAEDAPADDPTGDVRERFVIDGAAVTLALTRLT